MTRCLTAILVLGFLGSPLVAARPQHQHTAAAANRRPAAASSRVSSRVSPAAKGRTVAASTRSSSSSAKAKPGQTVVARRVPVTPRRLAAGKTNLAAANSRRVAATRGYVPSKRRPYRRFFYNPWKEPTYADSTVGDETNGEDPMVRAAAVEALGPLNGSVVVVDPQSGRILSVVNQDLAFQESFTPCSTIKIFVGLAGLSEAIIERNTEVNITRRFSLNLTEALARSDNPYFQILGQQLGFERVTYYARLFGLGERATTSPREVPGQIAAVPPDGVGYLSSHGHGVKLSPLQLAAAMAAIANGGTLHHLQYPESQTEAARLVPRVKRHIEIDRVLPELRPGLAAAVETGTARRAGYDSEEPIWGKTGTCTDRSTPTHLGWFGSYNEVEGRKLVVVVLLTGGAPINGPVASGVAGKVYRALSEQGYYGKPRPVTPLALVEATGGLGGGEQDDEE